MVFILLESWKLAGNPKKCKIPPKTLIYRNFPTLCLMMIWLLFLHYITYIAVLYIKKLTKKPFMSQKWDLGYCPLLDFPFCFSKKRLFLGTISILTEKRSIMAIWNHDNLKLQPISNPTVYNTYMFVKNWRLNNFFTKKYVLSPGKVLVSWRLS